MSKIVVITAANEKFKELAEMTARSSEDLGYETVVYDLGGLGFGKPFNGRVNDKIGAKIPSKPNIILDALKEVQQDDYVVWLDADAILWGNIDDIKGDWDIGVTVRQPKAKENDLPINAGVVFVKKTPASVKFVSRWVAECENSMSDQTELNKICKVTTKDLNTIVNRADAKISVFPCSIYNNFYFKKPQDHAKIIHYKSKCRSWWPRRTTSKIPKKPSATTMEQGSISRF